MQAGESARSRTEIDSSIIARALARTSGTVAGFELGFVLAKRVFGRAPISLEAALAVRANLLCPALAAFAGHGDGDIPLRSVGKTATMRSKLALEGANLWFELAPPTVPA